MARATDRLPPVAHDPLAYYGHKVEAVVVEGVPWSRDLGRLLRGAVRVRQPLTFGGVQRAILLLQNSVNDGRRLSRITVVVDPLPSGSVGVRFVVEPLRKITRVTIEGETALGRDVLLRAASLPLGSELWPEVVQTAALRIAQAYFQAGWRDARVGWEARPSINGEGVTVAFAVAEGRPTTLVELEFTGDKGLSDEELYAAFNLNPDDQLNLDVLEEGLSDLRARYRKRQFYLARVGEPRIDAVDERAVVEIPLSAGPRFRLQVRGNRSFSQELLLSKLGYTGEDPLDDDVQRDLAARLESFYQSAGFPDAHVAVRENTPSPSERLVTFLITEGTPVQVVQRAFAGLHFKDPDFTESALWRRVDAALEDATPPDVTTQLDDAELGKIDQSSYIEKRHRTPHVVPSEVFNEAAYSNACSEIANLYKSKGFLNARVGPAERERVAPGKAKARVIIPIDEGPQVFVRSVTLSRWMDPFATVSPGREELLPTPEVMKAVTIKPGDYVSFARIEDSRKAIIDFYKSKGYLFADADDKEEDAPPKDGRAQMDVTFLVKPGRVVTVSAIEIKGTTHTDQSLVRNALTLKVGATVTPDALQSSVENLLNLGIFTAAAVDVADPDREEYPKRLVVRVREKPTLSVNLRGGLSLVDGPRVAATFQAGNLGGRNRTIALTTKFNYPVFRYNGLFVGQDCGNECQPRSDPLERYLSLTFGLPIYGHGGTPIDQHYDLVNENAVRPAYQLESSAAVATFGNLFLRKVKPEGAFWSRHQREFDFSLSIQTDVEYDIFTPFTGVVLGPISLADQKTLLLPPGPVSLFSFRPTFTIDGRDNALNPTSGFYASFTVDFSKSIGLFETKNRVQLLRGMATVSGYVPIVRQWHVVLALSGSLGGIEAAAGTNVIGTKRFFLGGTANLRGFTEDGLIPEDTRRADHASIYQCRALVSGATCAPGVSTIDSAAGTTISPGGNYMALVRAELRFPLTHSLDGGLFTDAGNLWLDPSQVNLTDLRYAVGFGVRFPLPIGPAAFDIGFNLHPDTLLQEPPFQIHLSVGLF